VKAFSADDTIWENRTLPGDFFCFENKYIIIYLLVSQF
jgi:hypothetical protein